MSDISTELAARLGASGWIAGAEAARYTRDWLDRYGVPPIGVARPSTTAEVAAVLSACAAHGVAVTPQGGNTSLCGAAVTEAAGGVILSLERMAQIGTPDPAAGSIEVEAGCVLATLHDALAPQDLMFPMHLGAEGSAQIGGLIATNAGGSHAMRFGMMGGLVLGLEVGLPNGEVWDGMRAVLRLWPAPRQRATCLLALPDAAALIAMGRLLRAEAGEMLTGLEFFSDVGLALALEHLPDLAHPLDSRAPWYLLAELSAGSDRVPLGNILEDTLPRDMEEGFVSDGTIAMSDAQRAALWRLREEQPEGQRLEGAQLKHDISVPPGRLDAFFEHAGDAVQRILAGCGSIRSGIWGTAMCIPTSARQRAMGSMGNKARCPWKLPASPVGLAAVSQPSTGWGGPRSRWPTRCAARWNVG